MASSLKKAAPQVPNSDGSFPPIPNYRCNGNIPQSSGINGIASQISQSVTVDTSSSVDDLQLSVELAEGEVFLMTVDQKFVFNC